MVAYLFLENGRRFKGTFFGWEGETAGELTFNTSAVGCLELLSDPASCGQIVMQTFPMTGNYGSIKEDLRGGRVCCAGFIAREWCAEPSNFRCEGTIDGLLKEFKIPGVCGIDTRELTRILRNEGAMNALITPKSELTEAELQKLREYKCVRPVETVGGKELIELPGAEDKPAAAVLDLGAGDFCVSELQKRNIRTFVLPYDYSAEDIRMLSAGGLMISDGPGDAHELADIIANVKSALGKMPVYGIGLGHELMALALGGETGKMPQGHRGGNQPVRENATGRVRITTQNHGSAVTKAPEGGALSFVNEHDGSIEGIDYKAMRAFSTQFTPCTDGGVNDTGALIDKFAAMLGGND